MKRLLFAAIGLCACLHISAQEEYEAFAISEFAYSKAVKGLVPDISAIKVIKTLLISICL